MDLLYSKPMRGHEFAKETSRRFQSAHEPSPELVYLTLQALQDKGHVEGASEHGKTVYTTTEYGRVS